MGMFDYIKNCLHCPYCGTQTVCFQTKDFDRTLSDLNVYDLKECAEIHTLCKACKRWVSINTSIANEADGGMKVES